MDLRNLVETHLDLDRLSKDLGEIGEGARLWAVQQWTRADMATLWEAAKAFRSLSLDDLVASSTPPLVAVIHDGKNSRGVHNRFQNHLCRRSDPETGGPLFGYTHHSLSLFTGPGYFMARPSTEIGEVDMDYTMVPSERPPGWPPIPRYQPRFGRLLYGGLVAVVRGLSPGVTIGRARKKERWLDEWFVLVREDNPRLTSAAASPA